MDVTHIRKHFITCFDGVVKNYGLTLLFSVKSNLSVANEGFFLTANNELTCPDKNMLGVKIDIRVLLESQSSVDLDGVNNRTVF